jgi:hypothetical protein
MPRGRRIAYDPALGRLWVVCETCHRWNLCPLEDRHGALYELERIARDHARALTHTANISLLLAPPLTLIRVGDAGRAEQAWWRYGRELRRRRLTHDSTGSRVSAAAFGAVAYLLQSMGLTDRDVPIDWAETPVTDVLRWRRFGWAAWYGRERCPYCHSTLRALRYEASWWSYPIRAEDGASIGLGVPCQRCDPWTPEKVYEIRGEGAENVLRRVLAYQNIAGASERRITDAAGAIEHAGSATEFALPQPGPSASGATAAPDRATLL